MARMMTHLTGPDAMFLYTELKGFPMLIGSCTCAVQIIKSFEVGPFAPGMGLFHIVNCMTMKNKGTPTLAFMGG